MIDRGLDLSHILQHKSANHFQVLPSRLADGAPVHLFKSKKVMGNGRSPFLQNEERFGGKNGTFLIKSVSYHN